MFIGSGLIFWLVCHLQTSFWLWAKAGAGDRLLDGIQAIFLAEARERFIVPIQKWGNEVQKLTQSEDS